MSRPGRILLIDDDAAGRNALRRALEKQGHAVEAHAGGRAALKSLAAATPRFDLVITDLRMPEMDGMEVLRRTRDIDADVPVLLITAFGTIENAVEAMQFGARDYLTKPLDLFEVRRKVSRALEAAALARKNRHLDDNASPARQETAVAALGQIIGVSPAVQELKARIEQVAPTGSSVLIRGESGTGKELVARAIHDGSPRCAGPFLPINCAAIPRDILESELFGHERGAFTGATSRKPGKFELASRGTLFLDEVGELPPDMQAKLLRVLEEKAFMRVGGVETVQVDVRIVAATNADLPELVQRGTFRADLFYRLKVVQLDIPPLRDRPEDIPVLARHFLAHLARDHHRDGLRLDDEALEILAMHPWPGNVRELRNLLESVVVLSQGAHLDASVLPPEYGGRPARRPGAPPASGAIPSAPGGTSPLGRDPASPAGAPGEVPESIAGAGCGISPVGDAGEMPPDEALSMAEMEKRHILKTLREMGFNRTRAARALGIGRRTLQRKLEEYRDQGEEIPIAASD
ncbi:MAG: sigma-54-dependent transcriptional regulator [Acidobacteriota bacterium]